MHRVQYLLDDFSFDVTKIDLRIRLNDLFDSTVTIEEFKAGNVIVTGRRSPVSLYSAALSSFEDAGPEDTYDQRDATGFIRLQGLRLRPPR